MAIMTRAQWQTLRDKHGVKKGAARVSMGDAFGAFHNAKGLKAQVTAAKKLKDVIKTYLGTVKQPDITRELNEQVRKQIEPWICLAETQLALDKGL